MFLTIVLSIWAAMHFYVGWRVLSIPWIAGHESKRTVVLLFIVLAVSYPIVRILNARGWHLLIWPWEFASATWMGLMFLLLAILLVIDVLTFGGYLFRSWILQIRTWGAEDCAQAGVSLMICGHTHHGQIWPFNYLVRLRYPLIGGFYEVNRMSVIVSRGAGTWGPRMRLWRPSEIVRIKLRSAGS